MNLSPRAKRANAFVYPPVFFLLFFFLCGAVANAQQWTGPLTGNISNANSGNVGIGTTTPNFLLDVSGGVGMGGQNCNLDPSLTYKNFLPALQNTGKMLIGWNRQAGSGETDFIANSGPGYPGGFAFWNYTNGGVLTPLVYMNALGNIGINTTAPVFPLDVYGTLRAQQATAGSASGYFMGLASGNGDVILQGGNGTWPAWWIQGTSGLLMIGGTKATEPSAGVLNITTNGNVLIGKTSQSNSTYMLDINGNARANQVVVNTTGADYVFDPRYKLSPLQDLGRYITKEHHLPGIAPAAQMQNEGLNLGDNQTRLLAKIEELTLYLIRQDKETATLKEKVSELEQRNKILEENNKTLQDLRQRIERLEHPEPHQ
jgi:hypothetical protein